MKQRRIVLRLDVCLVQSGTQVRSSQIILKTWFQLQKKAVVPEDSALLCFRVNKELFQLVTSSPPPLMLPSGTG